MCVCVGGGGAGGIMSSFSEQNCKINPFKYFFLYVLLWIKCWLMWFEILLVFILFKFKKRPNISGIRVENARIINKTNKKIMNLQLKCPQLKQLHLFSAAQRVIFTM